MSSNELSAILFPNGNIAVFKEGQQVPELQKNPIELWCEHAVRCGYNPEGVVIETPSGNWRIFRTERGWNWYLDKTTLKR